MRKQGQLQEVAAGAGGLPKARTDEKALFVSGYEAAAPSTVTVAGQDKETNTAEINIEPGKDAPFIVATYCTSIIWRLSGVAERVSRSHRALEAQALADWPRIATHIPITIDVFRAGQRPCRPARVYWVPSIS
jgi:hypothetical protein